MAIDKDIKKGLKISFGIVLGLSLFFGIVFAIGFHSAEEILGGTFNGNFIFEDNVSFNGQVSGIASTSKLENLDLICNLSNEGYLKYNSSQVQFCDGTEWKSLMEKTSFSSDPFNVLLLHFDDDLIDYSMRGQNVAETGNVNFGQGKFGNAVYFDPSNTNYLEVASADFNFGSGDYTIDYWIKTADDTTGYIFGNKWPGGSGNEQWGTYGWISAGAHVWGACSGSTCSSASHSAIINDNNWHHIAYVRSGANHMLFVDGVKESSPALSGATVNFASDIFSIGLQYPNGNLTGYVDEFRISKGIARWTTDFTVPSEPYS